MHARNCLKRLRSPLIAVAIFVASLGISTAYNSYEGKREARPEVSFTQLKLEAQALAHSSQDEISGIIADRRQVTLDAVASLTGVSSLRIGPSEELLVLDTVGQRAVRFGPDGKLLGPLGTGTIGTHPGDFLFPSGIDPHGQHILVSDFKQSRVSELSPRGVFEDSFSIANERYSAKALFSPADGSHVYVCGNRYSAGLTTIHSYSSTGQYEASLLPLPAWAQALNLDAFNDCLPALSENRTLVAFPYEYKIYELARDVAAALPLPPPSSYRKPMRPLVFAKVDRSRYRSVFETWKTEWTPLEAIALAGRDTLAVQYKTYNPLRYTLDMWSLQTSRLIKTIRTNQRLLTAQTGRLYFEVYTSSKGDRHEILSGVVAR